MDEPRLETLLDFARALTTGDRFPAGNDPSNHAARLSAILSRALPDFISVDGDEIRLAPLDPSATRISIDAAGFSIGDVLLVLAPALLLRQRRSVVTVQGETHGEGVSISAIRGCFRGLLMERGAILAVTVKRYSFSGDPAGECEFRIYPREIPESGEGEGARPLVLSSPGLAEEAGRYRDMAQRISGMEAAQLVIHGSTSPGLYVTLPGKKSGALCHDFDVLHDETGRLRGENFMKSAERDLDEGCPIWYRRFGELIADLVGAVDSERVRRL